MTVPPLRDRLEDLPLLAQQIRRQAASALGREPAPLSQDVLAHLRAHPFPGNVRQLRGVLEQVLATRGVEALRPEDLAL